MGYGSAGQILDAGQAAAVLAKTRDTNSVMQGWIDRGPWIYWDMVTFVAGAQAAQQYNPFSIPIGQLDPVTQQSKTKLQTNMTQSKSFAPPRCLLLEAIGFEFLPGWALSDMQAIISACYMVFKIDEKIFHEGYLLDYPPGGGITGFSSNAGDASFSIGLPAPQYQRRYGSWSKYIAPLQQFSLEITFGGGGVAIPTVGVDGGPNNFIRVTLDGLTDRSVQ